MPTTDALDERRFAAATAERLQAAAMFATLTPEQWRTPSLRAGWTVREVAAHLLQTVETTFTWPRLVRWPTPSSICATRLVRWGWAPARRRTAGRWSSTSWSPRRRPGRASWVGAD